MSAHSEWKAAASRWRGGHGSDETVLRQTANYLHESANWVEIRDFLLSMAWSKQQILDWFSDQDFPDFREAVEEGWGWPDDMDDAA